MVHTFDNHKNFGVYLEHLNQLLIEVWFPICNQSVKRKTFKDPIENSGKKRGFLKSHGMKKTGENCWTFSNYL